MTVLDSGRHLDLPGVRLWYLDSGGDGETVVFLHANTGTSLAWAPQLEVFADSGYRVVAPDRRGWGRSLADASSGPQPGSVAEDLDALADALGLDAFHLVAVAGGTFSALDYSAWRPERVRSLVAAASTGMIVDEEIAGFISRIAIPGVIAPAPALYREVSAGFRGAEVEATARWVEIEERARQPNGAVELVRTPNSYAKLAFITAPTFVLAGGADLIAPPAMMRLWAAHLANHRFAVIGEAGHAIAYEQPERFNELVLGFIGELGQAPT